MAIKRKEKRPILKKRKAAKKKRKILSRKPKVRKPKKMKAVKRSQPSHKATARRRKVLSRKSKAQSPKSKKSLKSKIKRIKKIKKAAKKIKKVAKKKTVTKKRKKPAYAKATARRRKKIAKKTKKRAVKKIAKKIARKKPRKKPTYQFVRKGKFKKPAVEPQTQETFSAQSLFRAKIKVIGVGGGGGSIVYEIGRSLQKATFVIADTDIRALKKRTGIKYFWFGQDLTHGLGTGVNVDLAKEAAELSKEKISQYFKDQDIIIFVASLGGGLGSGATQVFAEAAREFGGLTFGIFTMPFKFEGKNKQRIAQSALRSLRQLLNVSLVIPNEKIFKVIDNSTPITAAFSTVNKSLIGSLESLIDLIYNPGIINIDFADLRTILRGRGNSAFLNTVEESGKNRVEKICENIFKNPLLQNSNFTAERILFNISGAENLSMFEVEKISSHIANLNPKAKIIFGISKNFKLKNKIKTTILMTGMPLGSQIKEIADKGLGGSSTKEAVSAQKARPKKKIHQKFAAKKRKKSGNKASKKAQPEKDDQKQVSFIPVFEVSSTRQPAAIGPKMEIIQENSEIGKRAIRRSALEIKKAEELQEKKRIEQEREWETPAFLRRIKFTK